MDTDEFIDGLLDALPFGQIACIERRDDGTVTFTVREADFDMTEAEIDNEIEAERRSSAGYAIIDDFGAYWE